MKGRLSSRRWALILGLCFALLALAGLLTRRAAGPGSVARIEVDGQVLRRIDLAAVTQEERFTVETPRGANTVELRPGGIRIAEADCPDQICVNTGWLTAGYTPIVCLPHRLVIALERGSEADAGVDAVTG